MLLVVSLDSENADWLREHMGNGNLPNLNALARSGTTVEVNAAELPGIAYPTMYTGRRAADMGFYFPVQWEPSEQRVVEWNRLPYPETLLQRLDQAGTRVVILDPPESRPLPLRNGFSASGVQFRARVLLHSWASDEQRSAELMRRLGPAPRADEVFGGISVGNLRRLRSALLQAPDRLGAAARECIAQHQPDCLWVTCCALHVAGHQFFHLPAIQDPRERAELEGTRLELARGYDRMIGSLLDVLPAGSRIFVTYPKGMGRVTNWSALLPAMLQRVLGQRDVEQPANSLRRLVPSGIRRRIALSISDRRALEILARLSTPRAEWSGTRAFCLPTDCPGFIQLNLAGRERYGIVENGAVRGLLEEINAGLRTFTDPDGCSCVEDVITSRGLLGEGRSIDRFPDLIVTWKQRPEHASTVRSPRFGEIRRDPDTIGRSGNHCPGAFTILAGAEAHSRTMQIEDIPATIVDCLGLPARDLPGRSFWK